LPESFEPGEAASERALQIIVARCLEESSRRGIKAIEDRKRRASLRKGAYYLARIIYLRNGKALEKLVEESRGLERKAKVAEDLIRRVSEVAERSFEDACKVFTSAMKEYLEKERANEDAALKNSEFAKRVDAASQKSTKL
jgi:hypothetical protein